MSSSSSEPTLYQEDDLGLDRRAPAARKRVEVYEEQQFEGANLNRSVHIGWGAVLGMLGIFGCMIASAATQSSSWNVSFRWLQRRVGFQFGTLTYIITTNAMYYHNGDEWVTRDWADIAKRWGTAAARAHPDTSTLPSLNGPIPRGFAADAAARA